MIGRFVVALSFSVGLSLVLFAQSAQEMYQRALVQEQAAGDLPQAIELYLQAAKAAGTDRSLAARAMARIAGAREKLGQQAEATEAYAELLRTYPEQREQALVAQTRLAALRKTSPAASPTADDDALSDVSAATNLLFEGYCTQCHNSATRSGGLDLASLNTKDVRENTAAWENLLRRLQARRDPPAGFPRPDDKTYRTAISRIERALDQAYPANGPLHTEARLSDTELATRIAAFLWNSQPDAQLLEEARRGRLHDPVALERTVQRMLRDPKSSHLVSNFLERWLGLDTLKKVQIDPARFPQFDSELLQSMETETRLFLDSQLRENHGALELWTAPYTYLNERLARHYGIAQISGKEFRRTTWPDSSRAGIAGQAGPLTALSVSSRTSPTRRGIYLFSKYLGMDVPSPPMNVPPLAETPRETDRPMRDRLAAHKSVAACANCHVTFDPLGLALENFDAIGRWRNTEGGLPINASGAFIDSTGVDGPAELRTGLLKYRDAYYANVTQQLLGYAINRKGVPWRLYDYEMPSVRAIMRSSAPNNYRWSSIISGIISSAPFQMKTIVP